MPAKWQQWFPFRIDAFKSSPAVRAMHPSARSGYLYLLAYAWQTDDCTIPCDPLQLAEISEIGDELWALHGPRIMRKFDPLNDDLEPVKYRNAALYNDWLEAQRVFERRKSGAVRTNSNRWATENKSDTASVSDRSASAGRVAVRHTGTGTGTGTGTRTGTGTGTVKQRASRKSAPEIEIPDWIPRGPWDAFVEMRKDGKHPLTGKAAVLAIGDLDKLRQQGHEPAEVLNQSTMRGWRGLFEVKHGGNGNGKAAGSGNTVFDDLQQLQDEARKNRDGGKPVEVDAGEAGERSSGENVGTSSPGFW